MATIQASFANAAEFFNSLLVLLSQKVAGDCHWESVIEGDSHFSI
jgi:hypothetical protein